jgi:anaerobic selenocysteine-containing dehydrogenase
MAFAGGGALGLALSPTPWYMVRDLAFWTQNWPWVPVPPGGEPSFEKTICRTCGGGCGVRVRKIGTRLVRIDGSAEHPVNRGSICPLGTAELQMLYGPARIKTPLKRTGTRRNPKWKPVSWEEAIAEVIYQIRELRAAGKSHTLAAITTESDSTVNQLLERLLQAIGSQNFMKMNAATDAQRIMCSVMQGVDAPPSYDIENARYILSFGCGLLEGWGAIGRMYHAHATWLADAERPSVEVVQIEPSLSVTGAKAAQWIPIKPGTEGALALGIAHILIRDKTYDTAFVEQHCFGFDDWQDSEGNRHRGFKTEVLERYSPETVASLTEVPVESIEELARRFAASRPSLALGGRGTGDLFGNLYELMAIHSLNALVGNISRAGGVLKQPDVPVSPLAPVQMDNEAQRGHSVPRIDEAGSEKYPFTRYLPNNLSAVGINMLLINEANPAYALHDRSTADELFERVPYIVCFSSYMNESAARSDLILPTPTPLERWDDQLGVSGLQYAVYNLHRPIVQSVYQTKNTGDIVLEVARGLGGTVAASFPWVNTVEVLRERTKGLYEAGTGVINTPEVMTRLEFQEVPYSPGPFEHSSFLSFWNQLVEHGCWFDPSCAYGNPEKSLRTPSGKFEFFSQRLRRVFRFADDTACMPHYRDSLSKPEGFDLTIMPENMVTMADNGRGTPPFLIKELSDDVLINEELFVQINPITAMRLKLKEGQRILLESPRGKAQVRAHIFEGVREDVVLIPLGFGHTAYDKFLRNKGVNAHYLFDVEKDTISGLPIWWASPGKITKV